jgi:hypothetical protein
MLILRMMRIYESSFLVPSESPASGILTPLYCRQRDKLCIKFWRRHKAITIMAPSPPDIRV